MFGGKDIFCIFAVISSVDYPASILKLKNHNDILQTELAGSLSEDNGGLSTLAPVNPLGRGFFYIPLAPCSTAYRSKRRAINNNEGDSMIVLNRILSLWGEGCNVVEAYNTRFPTSQPNSRTLSKERTATKPVEVTNDGNKAVPANKQAEGLSGHCVELPPHIIE